MAGRKKVQSPGSYLVVFIIGFLVATVLYELPTLYTEENLEQMEISKIVYANSNVVAVISQGSSGIIGKVTAEIHPDGQGRVLMNTNPFLEPDTQQSAETATRVAEKLTGKSLADKDVIFSFDIPGEVVGGPSAGAAMTTAVIAAIEDRQVRSDVTVTGTISLGGAIGQIGSVLEKAQAAAENNMTLFLVPEGQGTLQYYEQQIKPQKIGNFVIQRVYYVPKTIDVNNYTMSEWGMPTEEVSNIREVVEHMII